MRMARRSQVFDRAEAFSAVKTKQSLEARRQSIDEATLEFLKRSMRGFIFIERDDLSSAHISNMVLK